MNPVINIRKQGFSSETLALSVTIGIIGGAFPVLGLASYVCLMLTLALKQNIIIVQVVNWFSYPLQILLMIPLMKFGTSIITGGELTITMNQVVVAFQSGILNGIREIGLISLYGVIAWTVIAIPCMFSFYMLLLIFFRTMKRIKLKAVLLEVNKTEKQNTHILPIATSFVLETLPVQKKPLKAG